ncbi:MAG: septum formation initiator family protein [Candidatus Bipolaricaulota bacterium]
MRGWAGAIHRKLNGIAGSPRRRLVVWGVAAAVLALGGTFLSRELAIVRLRHERTAIARELRDAEGETKSLEARLAAASDPAVIETEARRRLGLVKPGEEKIFFLEQGVP